MNEITMVAAAVLLLLAGAGIGFLLGRKGRSNATSKLEETQAEFDDYRKDVTRHFDQTAEQFQAIGQQYRDLYEHMAKGAEAFCVPTEAGSALPFSSQTRLPTDVEETDTLVDDTPEVLADEQPKDHVVQDAVDDTPVDEQPLETEAAAEETPEESVEASEAEGETELAAEAAEEAEAKEEVEAAVEPTPEKPKDESERIYH